MKNVDDTSPWKPGPTLRYIPLTVRICDVYDHVNIILDAVSVVLREYFT